ncbi:hypothetical protein IWW48_002714 [Coemansia sp. RSA 1200]|nr:hypothetical protein IWW48_002714 [Coemansia sp. RSA 1200]
MNNKALFVKDCDDIFIQRSSDDAESNNPTNGFRTSVYKHTESNMRVVVCRVPSPIYSAYITVSTQSVNDKGLPHALEHLVLCGSKNYPIRGYLGALAACNCSLETNGVTFDDHTEYTIFSAAEDAMANVLPVFLDHVLNPLLSDSQFITEVYHYDEAGKEKGVMFSEMASRENSVDFLEYYHIFRLMWNSSATHSYASGGKTRDIATLTKEEVIDYHRKYYDANNVTVILTGAFTNDFEEEYLQTIPSDIIKSRGCDSRAPMDCSLPGDDDRPTHKTVKFPSSDTSSTGSLSFAWHGPPHEDVETAIALEIMNEYLSGSSSSPLDMWVVGRPSSSLLATSVELCMFTYVKYIIKIRFYGVPYVQNSSGNTMDSSNLNSNSNNGDFKKNVDNAEAARLFEENYFKNLLLDEFKRIFATRFDGDPCALEKASKRLSNELAANIEKDPGEAVNFLLYSDIVTSNFSPDSHGKFHIGSRAKKFDMIAKLGKRPVEFWLELLKKWYIDGTVYSVAMIPDSDLEVELEAERKEAEQANRTKIVDKEAHARNIKEAAEANKAHVPEEIKKRMPTPDPSKISILPHTQRLIVLDKPVGPVNTVQTINVDSGFVNMEMQIPINDIPDELRKYLVLFENILLSAHLVLPAGIIYDDGDSGDRRPLQSEKCVQYAEFESRMSDCTTYYNSRVGHGLLPFSFNWLDDMFVINFCAPYKRYPSAMRLMVQGIMFSQFTTSNILTNAQAHLVSISEGKQDVDDVLFTVATHFAGASPADMPMMNKRHTSFLAQEKLMKKVIEQIEKDGNAEDVIEKLKEIQNILIRATTSGGRGGFMALSLPSNETPEDYISIFENEWNMCYEKYAEHNGITTTASTALVNKSPFPIDYASRFPALEEPLFIHVPTQSLQVSKSVFVSALDTPSCPTGKRSFDDELSDLIALDYYALWMLSEFMGRMNGPVGNAVRGKGYAYGGFLYILWKSKWIGLEVDYASDIVKAVDAVKQLFLDMQDNWDSYLSDTDVSLARSTVMYKTTVNQSTPTKMLSQTVLNSVHGFSSAEEHNRWCSTHIAAVGMSDMRRVFDKYVCRFIDNDYPMLRLLVTPMDVAIPKELGLPTNG